MGNNWAMGYILLTSVLDNIATLDSDLLPSPGVVATAIVC